MLSQVHKSVLGRELGLDEDNNLVIDGQVVASPDLVIRQALYVADLGSTGNFVSVPSAAGGVNLAAYAASAGGVNAIDAATFASTVYGGALGGYFGGMNLIGASFLSYNGTSSDENYPSISAAIRASFTADTYISATASYATVWGYDNVCNGLIGQIGGAHNHIYTAASHGIIWGTISNIVDGDYCSVFSGTGHTINLAATTGTGASWIGAGNANSLTGTGATGGVYSVIANGNTNTISGTGNFTFIGTGITCQITATGDSNAILTGQSNVISGTCFRSMIGTGSSTTVASCNWAFVGAGRTIALSNADYGFVGAARDSGITAFNGAIPSGDTCTVSAKFALAQGYGVNATIPGSLNWSARKNAAAGDAQGVTFVLSRQTTDATADTPSYIEASNFATIPVNTILAGKFYVAGRSAAGASCAYEIPCVIERGATATHTIRKGGAGGDVVTLYDGITVAGVPLVAGGNQVYIGLTGKAATVINWSATFFGSQVA